MDIIFDIVDNVANDSVIIITVIFQEKYNVSIERDGNIISVHLFDTISKHTNSVNFSGLISKKKYKHIKKYITQLIDNIQMKQIIGLSYKENKEYLSNYFNINNNILDHLVVFDKKFI